MAKVGLMCLNQQKYIYLTLVRNSAVVLQIHAFANILPLAPIVEITNRETNCQYSAVISKLVVNVLFAFFNPFTCPIALSLPVTCSLGCRTYIIKNNRC